jgi:DNA polymerase III epsilon subunit-like protein
MKREQYFSVDVESAGPIPGTYSMLALGACVVGKPSVSFYAELKPISKRSVADALRVSGFSLAALEREGDPPEKAMRSFRRWVEDAAKGYKPIFVGFNATYDWQFVNWYFEQFSPPNPFGFGGIDIKSYYMGLSGRRWSETTSSQLPSQFHPNQPQTHNALEDARAQASIFAKMMREARRRSK